MKTKYSLIIVTLLCGSLALAAKTAPPAKKEVRKPNQAQESYFHCAFSKKGEANPIYDLNVRTPVTEEQLVYRESNRMTTLLVQVLRTGHVNFTYTDEMARKTLASARKEVPFDSAFKVTAQTAAGEWTLDCKN